MTDPNLERDSMLSRMINATAKDVPVGTMVELDLSAMISQVNASKFEREKLIDALRGCRLNSAMSDQLEKQGFMYFSGNQWNEAWSWREEKLQAMTTAELDSLYRMIKEIVK